MLDAGPANPAGEDDADLAVFVDRLAAAGSDQATKAAQAQIRRSLAEGITPPGLRRLAEALAASLSELPPPRRPGEDTTLVAAMRDTPLVVLDGFDVPAVASAVAALLADGRRVVVTAATPAELAAVRRALPAGTAGRVLDMLPTIGPAELRELRTLLVTSTPQRRARLGLVLPPPSAVPPVTEVAELCAQAAQPIAPTGNSSVVPVVAAVLGGLEDDRLAAVTSVADSADRSLADLRPWAEHEWVWRLLSELIYGRHRGVFERMREESAQAMDAVERAYHAPPAGFVDTPPVGSLELLRRYHDFLEAGGRTRTVFRSPLQREVQPVLSIARVGNRVPETKEDVQCVIEHLELVERSERIEAGCQELGIPAPRNQRELTGLAEVLGKVAAAARSVSALRRDVLFLAPGSPLAVPDVDAVARIATAILEYADSGSADGAAARLGALADALARAVDGADDAARAPEFEQAVAALRAHDAGAYAVALDALWAARREAHDEARRTALLQRTAAGSPELAAAWAALADTDPTELGFASFVPVGPLLSALPASDTADVVIVLGAATLGVERLLLTAVAPRMVAVAGPGERAEPPTLLSVLQRASALVIPGRSGSGRVLPISDAASSRTSAAPISQAGA